MEERKEGGNREGKGGGVVQAGGGGKREVSRSEDGRWNGNGSYQGGVKTPLVILQSTRNVLLTHSLTYSTYDRTKQNTNELPNQPTRANEIEETLRKPESEFLNDRHSTTKKKKKKTPNPQSPISFFVFFFSFSISIPDISVHYREEGKPVNQESNRVKRRKGKGKERKRGSIHHLLKFLFGLVSV